MKLKAYILAADPAWIEASVNSYYNAVDEIVVSYDENGIGYTGVPVPVEECLKRLQTIDLQKKMRFCPGHYARLEHTPMENETYQRQCAIEQIGKDTDWILQLDTDEVIADFQEFKKCLAEADTKGFKAVDYPARYLFCQLGNKRYLETCTRFWRITSNYPGQMAIKPGVVPHYARHTKTELYRVDFSLKSTSKYHSKSVVVHRKISATQAIFHFSWVRSEKQLLQKLKTWSHSKDVNTEEVFAYWKNCQQHPYISMLKTPFKKTRLWMPERFRIVSVKQYCDPDVEN